MEQIRILLVEDNPLDVRLLREALKALNGHQPVVTNVSRLDEALARLQSDPFDIVLLDLSLPDSEGFDTLVRLRNAVPDKPIVVLTGYDDDRFAVRAVQEGAQDYLVKGEMDGGTIMRSVRYAIERARTLAELRGSEERYRLLAENVRDVIWTADAELRMTFVSPSVFRLQGYTAEEMIGRPVSEMITPESLKLVQKIYEDELAAERTGQADPDRSRTLELELCHKDGTSLWTEITASLLRDDKGKIIGFTGVSRDISERKRNARIQSVLYQIAEATTVAQDLESLLVSIRRKLGRLLDTTNFYVALYDEQTDRYEFPCFWDQCDPVPASPRQMPKSLTDYVRRTKTPLLMDPPRHRALAESGEVEPCGTLAAIWLGAPLMASHGVIGVVVVQSYVNPDQYTERDRDLLTIVAGSLALAIERKRAETARREAHNRLETLVQAIPEIVYFKDALGRNLVVNKSFEKLVGGNQKDIIGKTDDDLFPADLAARCRISDEKVKLSGAQLTFEESASDSGGRITYFDTIKVPLFDDSGNFNGLVGVSRDITERKLAEETLRTTTSQLKNLFDNLDYVFVSMDIVRRRVLQISPACEKVYGFPKQAFFDDPNLLSSRAHPSDRFCLDEMFESLRLGETFTGQLRIIRSDGEMRWVEVNAKPTIAADGTLLRVDGVIVDITQRKRAEQIQTVLAHVSEATGTSDNLEELLSTIRKELGMLLDTTNFFVALYDSEKNVYSFPVFADQYDTFGLSRRSLPKSLTDYVRRTGQPLLADESVYRRLEEEGEVELIGTNSRVWLGAPLRTAQGVIGVVVVQSYTDEVLYTEKDMELLSLVSGHLAMAIERKRAVDALFESEEQLRQAQKMEAVGRLAGGIAHDFNNLLTSILGHSELTLYKLHEDDPLREGIEQIMKSAERAASLTRQLLAFSRKQVLQPRVLALNGIVSEMEKMLRRLIGEDVQLVTRLEPEVDSVKADPGQLEQVLMNLAVNARDAMPGGGKLVIETSNVALDELYTWLHGDITPGRYIMLAVSDNGHGMDSETLTHIFEPFFTTKEHGKGTGLGLSTVYGIVKQSGGHIYVYSEVGRGTTFKIYLPRVEEAAEALVIPASDEPLHGNETVLLVEDEDGVRDLVRKILERKGYRVLSARATSEALQIVELNRETIHLLLTDVIMPELSGDELARRISGLRPEIRVLYMSGYTDDSIGQHGVLDPGIAFLEKPFTADALARKVRQVLDTPAAVL